jgi:hypothetical protein
LTNIVILSGNEIKIGQKEYIFFHYLKGYGPLPVLLETMRELGFFQILSLWDPLTDRCIPIVDKKYGCYYGSSPGSYQDGHQQWIHLPR